MVGLRTFRELLAPGYCGITFYCVVAFYCDIAFIVTELARAPINKLRKFHAGSRRIAFYRRQT